MKKYIRIIPLRFWLPFLVFGTFLLLASVFTMGIQQAFEDDLYERSMEYVTQDMSELSRDMMENLVEDDFNQADRLLTRKGSKKLYNLLVAIDINGKIYSSTNKGLLGSQAKNSIANFDPTLFQQTINNNKEQLQLLRSEKCIKAYFPIQQVRTPYSENESFFGAIYLEYDLSLPINRIWQHTWQTVQVALFTGLLFTSLFYALLNYFVNRPLAHLAHITRRIADGQFGIKSDICGEGEFAELNSAVNTMSDQLNTTIEKLENSEKQQQEILWGSSVGTWVYDINTGRFTVNERWGEILGYAPGEFNIYTINECKELLHPDEKSSVMQSIKDKLEGKISYLEVEMRLRTKDNDWAWVKTRGRIVDSDPQGKPVRMSGTITDIGKRKKAEAAMLMRDRSLESFVVGIIIFDVNKDDMPIVYCNDAVPKMTGYSEQEILGKNFMFLQEQKYQPKIKVKLNTAISFREECNVQVRCYKKDGSMFWNDFKISPVFDDYGNLTNYIASLNDITEKKLTEERLHILIRAMESTDSPMIILDQDLMIEYVNPALIGTLGYSEQELSGRHHSMLRSRKVPENIYKKVWQRVHEDGIWKGVFENTRKNGETFFDRCTISSVKDMYGRNTHFVCIHEDVTREHELTQKLGYEATHDNLTGLINRLEFERRATQLLETTKKDNREHAMCFMDLDQFKVINDSCGHSAGDELLRQIVVVLKSVTRKNDMVARLGGDEFAVLMEECTVEQAHRVANDILNAIQDFNFVWEGRSFKVGISIGLVKIDSNVSTLEQLLKQGDTACYMAKDLGRNRIHIYYTHDSEIALRESQTQWIERIYQALDNDLFCFYAQPIMKTQEGVTDHYELLIRMLDDTGNTIPPGIFLPAAERFSVITKIDQWVVDHAVNLLERHESFLESIDCISINLSGQSLGNTAFIEHITDLLKKSSINTNKICFEITETSAISNLNVASDFIHQMRQIGCRFSLDDFGSGLSSFAYLKQLPVDYLKIDGLFVKDIATDKIDRAMVSSMNEIGNVMGMQTIAEFVENDEILSLLKDIGVDYAQGYGIAKPEPLDNILEEAENTGTNIIKFKK